MKNYTDLISEAIVHGFPNGDPKAYDKIAKHYDQWIKQVISTHQPNMRLHKYFSDDEPLNDFAPKYHRWEIYWNSKPCWIVLINAEAPTKDKFEPKIGIGIDGRGFLRGPKVNKMATRLEKLNKKGFRNYEQFRAALELPMDIFPPEEIPEEYR